MGKTKNEKKQRRERERPNRQERKDLAAAAAAAAGAADDPAAAEAQGDDDVAMGSASDRAGPGDDDVSMGASSSSWAGGAEPAESSGAAGNWWEQQGGAAGNWWEQQGRAAGNWWEQQGRAAGNWWEQQGDDGAAAGNWWEQQGDGGAAGNWWEPGDGGAAGNWDNWWEHRDDGGSTEQWQQAEQADADAGGSTDQQAEQADESAAAEGAATEGAADRSDDSEESWGDWRAASPAAAEGAATEGAADRSDDSEESWGDWRAASPAAGAESEQAEREMLVPRFCPDCNGCARDWNRMATTVVSKRTRKGLAGGGPEWPLLGQPALRAGEVDLWLKKFLSSRPGPSGESLAGRLGCATAQPGGWWRVPWVLEQESPPFFAAGADIRKGWHGCKMEALYSIIYHGRIFESADEAQGHRYFADRPGVYLHADSRAQKAENYINFVGMSGDGIFWAAKWEVLYDVSGSVKGRKATDQLIYAGGAVRLSALFLATHTRESLPTSCHVTEWQPLMESNPTA